MNGKPIYFSKLCQICQSILRKILCIYFSAACKRIFNFLFTFGYQALHAWPKKGWIIAFHSNLRKGTLMNLFCDTKRPEILLTGFRQGRNLWMDRWMDE